MLCRDKCGYCTFAKPPAHLVSPYLELDEVLAIARRGAALGCHEALFTLGEAPEARYPDAAAWLAARGYSSTVDYLVAAAAAVLAETGLLPHANAGALDARTSCARLRAVSPSQGMMIETPGRPPGRARRPARRRPRQDRPPAASPRSRPRAGPGCRSPPASSSASARPAPSGSTRCVAIRRRPRPPRSRAGGDRPELPAQAGHRDVARAGVPARRVPLDHRRRPPGARPVDPPAGAAQPLRRRRPRRARRRRHRRLGRRLAGHPRPREPRAARGPSSTCCATPPRPPGTTLAPRLTVYPEYVRDGDAGCTPTCASRCACASDLEGLARDDAWAAGGDVAPPIAAPRRAAAGLDGPGPHAGRRGARRRARGRRGRRRRDRHAARRARTRLPRRRRGRRPAARRHRRRRGHVRAQPQHQLHERVHVQVQVLRVLEGPAVAQPARHALPPRPRGDPAPRARGGRLRRHRGVPAGRHPPRLRRRLLPRRWRAR